MLDQARFRACSACGRYHSRSLKTATGHVSRGCDVGRFYSHRRCAGSQFVQLVDTQCIFEFGITCAYGLAKPHLASATARNKGNL